LSELSGTLERQRAALLTQIRDALEQSENQQYIALIDGSPTDIADESISDALADLNVAMIDRHVGELRDIEAAQARIKAHDFGACIDCGVRIPVDRLRAYPTAQRCLDCQRQREHTYAHGGTPTL
jgi:RNA polymerase-binding protein DksA